MDIIRKISGKALTLSNVPCNNANQLSIECSSEQQEQYDKQQKKHKEHKEQTKNLQPITSVFNQSVCIISDKVIDNDKVEKKIRKESIPIRHYKGHHHHHHNQHNNQHNNQHDVIDSTIVRNHNHITQMGQINHGYVECTRNSRPTSNTPSLPSNVYREQYWMWSCRCHNWTKRERIFLLVIGILFCIIFGCVVVICVLASDKKEPIKEEHIWWNNFQMRS